MQALVAPQSTALSTDERTLSYHELDCRTNQVAYDLRRLGVHRNAVVALCADRSIEFVVGALAILKAGGAYIPLDPAYPVERLRFMLVDSGARVLVTTVAASERLSSLPEHTVVLDDGSRRDLTLPALTGDDLAYVIYTSGSTGQPKGVAIGHQSVANLLVWHQNDFGVTPQDRASQLASPSFDAAGWEVWPYLTAGATVCLPDEDTRSVPERLRNWLVAQRITISFAPTPLAERLLELDWPAETALRTLLVGGDVLHRYPRADLPFRVVNNYGPTENTVVATSGTVLPVARPNTRPSIGRPIAQVQVHILDWEMEPVAVGAIGELYLGGSGLARGYLNRPALTAERFVASPLASSNGERLYKTGDLACWLSDGSIEFHGRIDTQVKIRGRRVELGEIEVRLSHHSAIQAVVVAGHSPLTAYVVRRPGVNASTQELRDYLAASLPEYMIPATFVDLAILPLTANGKVDRAALPIPDRAVGVDETFAGPCTVVEARLERIVSVLLNVARVPRADNVFLIGGHSLFAAQLIARVQDEFGVALTLRTIFDAPTIAALAVEIEERIRRHVESMSDEDARRLLGTPA